MAVAEGRQVDVFYDTAGSITDIDSVEALAISTNLLENVTDLGAIDASVNIIEFPIYGSDIASKIRGLDTPGDLTFDLAFDPDDDDHVALATGEGTSANIIVKIGTTAVAETNPDYSGGNDMLYGMEGLISSASMAAPVDGVSTLTVTMALTKQVVAGQPTA